jgi:hypothetical protein
LSAQLLNPQQNKITSKNTILPTKMNKWKLFKVQDILYMQSAFESAKNSLEHVPFLIMLCKGICT